MQKRKFDELISHFNRNVSDMSIDRKYKIELLGMISAIGFAHEEELGTNLAEVGTDCISRQAAIDALCNDYCGGHQDCKYYPNCENLRSVQKLPSAQPERARGTWMPDTMCYYEERFICSECKGNYKVDTCMGKPMWNFCPNCGADMRGEQDE